MKKNLFIIGVLALVKLVIQLLGNRNYGFHRDELLHLSVSEHLDWGYYEFPPFIAIVGKLSYLLFNYSLTGTRLFPTLAGITILVLCCLMAKELGGKTRAIFFSGICILAFVPFYRNHTLFQPVAFDQLFWTAGFYFLIKYINSQHKKHLLWVGCILGLGLLNKYTMLVWAFGIFTGIVLFKTQLLKNKWLYISGILSFLIFLPNILWQMQHDFPLIRHMQKLKEKQLDQLNTWTFLFEQAEIVPLFIMFLCGLGGFLFLKKLQKYRFVGVAALVIFITMWLLKSKTYYVFSLYPVVFAAGTVTIEYLLRKRPNWVYVAAAFIMLPMIYFIPEATPILPIETHIQYKAIQPENGRYQLTGDYADMFGWEEQVKLVDSVYQTLTLKEQQNCTLWAENYGEAGALKILGKKYNLPNPVSRHGSFWQWGYGNKTSEVWISIGNEKPSVMHVFEEVTLIKTIYHPYAIDEENQIPLYLCKKPKINIHQWWQNYQPYIFD